MVIYGLTTCDTCRAARAALPAARFRDVRAEPLAAGEISALLAALGEGLVNRRSTTWRGLSQEERAAPAAELLARHPALMKRPVIEAEGVFHLGWTDAVREAVRHA